MTKYLLVSIYEREFLEPAFFDSLEDACDKMKSEMLEQLGSFDDHVQFTDYDHDKCGAWANHHGNSDWIILRLRIVNGDITLVRSTE